MGYSVAWVRAEQELHLLLGSQYLITENRAVDRRWVLLTSGCVCRLTNSRASMHGLLASRTRNLHAPRQSGAFCMKGWTPTRPKAAPMIDEGTHMECTGAPKAAARKKGTAAR